MADIDPEKLEQLRADIRKLESHLAHKKAELSSVMGMERPAGFQDTSVTLDMATLERLIGRLLCVHGDAVREVSSVLGEYMADRLVREARKEQE